MEPSWQDALRRDAVAAFQRAVRGDSPDSSEQPIRLIAVDACNQVILEVLGFGASGKQLFDELGIVKLVAIDTTIMDGLAIHKQAVQRASALSGSGSGSNHRPGVAVVFILPPSRAVAKLLAQVLQCDAAARSTIDCTVLWLPTATPECTIEMERQGVVGLIQQRNLSLGLLPVDDGVASLCHDRVFAELYLHGQQHALTAVVQSILAMERLDEDVERSGKQSFTAPRVTCHGPFALRVKHMLDLAHSLQPPRTSVFDEIILIDRMEDPLSMLLTPMTYEGLLDALMGMNHGVVSVERVASSEIEGTPTESRPTLETVKLLLSQDDELYGEIRDENINTLIGNRLAQIAQTLVTEVRGASSNSVDGSSSLLDGGITNATPRSGATLAQVTALLKKVPQLVKKKRSLGHHISLVEHIQRRSQDLALRTCVDTEMSILSSGMKRGIRFTPASSSSPSSSSISKDVDRVLEEAILRDPPLLDLYDALKLLCLRSLASGGLKSDALQWYRQQLCHTYGYHILPLLVQLEKLELLSSANKFDYPRRRRELVLLQDVAMDDSSDATAGTARIPGPFDIHFMFPYTGYAPMSVRLVQTSLGMKLKPGKDLSLFSTTSSTSSVASSTSSRSNASRSLSEAETLFGGPADVSAPPSASSASFTQQRQRVMVYYIGGVTVAELAAYRLLNRTQPAMAFYVATTAICNGNRLLRAM